VGESSIAVWPVSLAVWTARVPEGWWHGEHAALPPFWLQPAFTTFAACESALWQRVHEVPAPVRMLEFTRSCSVPSRVPWHASHGVESPLAASAHSASPVRALAV
jgi:hypothetical protein